MLNNSTVSSLHKDLFSRNYLSYSKGQVADQKQNIVLNNSINVGGSQIKDIYVANKDHYMDTNLNGSKQTHKFEAMYNSNTPNILTNKLNGPYHHQNKINTSKQNKQHNQNTKNQMPGNINQQ